MPILQQAAQHEEDFYSSLDKQMKYFDSSFQPTSIKNCIEQDEYPEYIYVDDIEQVSEFADVIGIYLPEACGWYFYDEDENAYVSIQETIQESIKAKNEYSEILRKLSSQL